MNDSNDFNGKNGKVKVMYVRSEGQDDGHSKGKRQQDNKRTNDRRGGGGRRNERSGRFDDRKANHLVSTPLGAPYRSQIVMS